MEQQRKIDWQGHRGARGILPENTIPAFQKALEYGLTTLELDVVVSKDSQIVVSHEGYMNHEICSHPDGRRVTKEEEKSLLLLQMDVATIQQYDVGKQTHPRFPEQTRMAVYKPTFKELVSAINDLPKGEEVHYNIEIKSEPEYDNVLQPPPAEFVRLMLAELEELDIKERINLQSFDLRVLREIKRQAPSIQLALLIWDEKERTTFEDNLNLLGFVPDIYSPYFEYVDADLCEAAHQKGMKVIPWTVNEKADMLRMIKCGVDGIITDYPNRIEEDWF